MCYNTQCRFYIAECPAQGGCAGYMAPPPTNADRLRAMSDEELLKFIAAVFCSGMGAENRGDDFAHSFVWTLDQLRQPATK